MWCLTCHTYICINRKNTSEKPDYAAHDTKKVRDNGEKVFVLRFIQGRNPDWVQRPFFAQYDEKATWLHHLKPAFGAEKFFFEEE